MTAYRDPRSGHWRYRARVTLPCGRRKRIGGTPAVNTRRAAEAAERDHILRLQNPAAAQAKAAQPKPLKEQKEEKRNDVPTVRDYLGRFLQSHYSELKPRHREEVKRMFNSYLLKRVGNRHLDEFTQEVVDNLRASLRSETRNSKTIDNIVTPLSTLLRYAHTNGVIPTVRAKFIKGGSSRRQRLKKVKAVPMEQVNALLGATIDPRYRMAILLGAEAGLRQGEIRGLRWGDIDGAINVRRALDTRNRVTAPKHDLDRSVPISERIGKELERLPKRGDYVVTKLRDGGALSYFAMLEKIHVLYEEAKVPIPSAPWHCLRHTYGTELARAGVDVRVIRELMGHASLETTMRYLTVLDEEKNAAVRLAFGSGMKKIGQHLANTETVKTGKR